MMNGLFLSVLLAGCGEPIPEAGETAAKPKVVKKPAADAAAMAAPPAPTYYYNPAGKRDPFQGTLNRKTTGQIASDDPDRPPLQRWDVEKFTLSGVIFNTQMPRALLIDPDGIGHVVKVGSYVGRNWGKVSAISQGAVVVTEEYQTLDGELVVNPVSLRFAGSEVK